MKTEFAMDSINGAAGIAEKLPLSHTQKTILAAEASHPDSTAYAFSRLYFIGGDFDLERFQGALSELHSRHETLQVGFEWKTNEPSQILYSDTEPHFEYLTNCISRQAVIEHAASLAQTRINPTQPSLQRCYVWEFGTSQYAVLLKWHYLILDEASIPDYLQELFSIYMRHDSIDSAYSDRFKSYLEWEAAELEPALEAQYRYWEKRLDNHPETPALPFDFHPNSKISQNCGHTDLSLSRDESAAIDRFITSSESSNFDFFAAILSLVLHRYTGVTDFSIGTNGRIQNSLFADVGIGPFLNNVVLRQSIDPIATFDDYLSALTRNNCSDFEHQSCPFEHIVHRYYRHRRDHGNPWFNVFFNVIDPASEVAAVRGILGQDTKLEPIVLANDASMYFMSVSVIAGETYTLRVSYNSELFLPETADWFARHILSLTRNVLENLDKAQTPPITELSIYLPEFENIVLQQWNDSTIEHEPNTLHGLVENAAHKFPDRPALKLDKKELRYAEFNMLADRLAASLLEKNIKKGDVIGLCAHRSLQRMVALLAILKCGAVYLPLDPEDPDSRLEDMVDDAEPSLILATKKYMLNTDVPRVAIDKVHKAEKGESAPPCGVDISGEDTAYLIYTSGSTGRPKGVVISHEAINNQIAWMLREHPLNTDDRVLQKTPYSFDVSIWEMFWPIASGACLVLARPGGHKDPEYLVNTIESDRITHIHFVPSMLREFIGAYDIASRCKSLKSAYTTGEALHIELAQRFHELLAIPLWNLYGPTEDAVHASSWQYDPESNETRTVPIGIPLDNTQAYILDGEMRLAPVGAIGELWLGGIGLAKGYWQRAGLTATSFRDNPLTPEISRKIYKTGDLVRYRPGGVIEYLGRIDNQIKLRGQRIELGEIESHIERHEEIDGAACAVINPTGEDQRLVAWFVSGSELDHGVLSSWLRRSLPPSWIPNFFVRVDHLPVSPSGKLDKSSLPQPDISGSPVTRNFVPADTQLERLLASAWAEVLGLESVGIESDFFEMGGHSLLGVRLIHRVEELLERPLPVSALQEISTIKHMVNSIESESGLSESEIAIDEDPEYRLWKSPEYKQMLVAATSSDLETINPGSLMLSLNSRGNRRPLFWCFNAPRREMPKLAKLLGADLPIYGMFSGGKILEPQTDANTRWVVDKYYDEIVSGGFAPPFHIGGNCRGASIAAGLAMKLVENGYEVEKLCLLEHFSSSLFDFEGQLMLLNGSESHLQEYKKYNWQEPGWENQFKRKPTVYMIPGRHGFFFADKNVGTLADKVREVLEQS